MTEKPIRPRRPVATFRAVHAAIGTPPTWLARVAKSKHRDLPAPWRRERNNLAARP